LQQDLNLAKIIGILELEGKIENHPISYNRTYYLEDDVLSYRLTIQAKDNLNLARFVENIPIVIGPVKKRGVEITGINQEGQTNKIIITDQAKAGVEIDFSRIHKIHVVETGLNFNGQIIGRVEIELPTRWKKGSSWSETVKLVPYFIK